MKTKKLLFFSSLLLLFCGLSDLALAGPKRWRELSLEAEGWVNIYYLNNQQIQHTGNECTFGAFTDVELTLRPYSNSNIYSKGLFRLQQELDSTARGYEKYTKEPFEVRALFIGIETKKCGRVCLGKLEGKRKAMIRKELLRLEQDGIFMCTKKGNLIYFYLNKFYPLYDELKSIVFKTIGIKGLLKEVLEKTKGTGVAFIYGSYAKNEENAKSDIDVFIIGKVDENKLVMDIGKLEKALKREINYSLYTRNDFKKKKGRKDSFILDLLENPKVFLVGDENEL